MGATRNCSIEIYILVKQIQKLFVSQRASPCFVVDHRKGLYMSLSPNSIRPGKPLVQISESRKNAGPDPWPPSAKRTLGSSPQRLKLFQTI